MPDEKLCVGGTPAPLSLEPVLKYWAFISYSQRDKEWSSWLHRSIETYRVPSRLVGRDSRNGKVPSRLFPVFRDREELPTSANLGANLEEALRGSRYLIVLCSPNSAASHWVNEEIRSFKAMGREDHILCLVIDGEPNATDKPNCGLPECFPEAVRFKVGADGKLSTERTEPIAADARPGKDVRSDALLKILAGLLGVGFDELRQRNNERRRRQRLTAAAGVLVILAMLAGIWFVQERAKSHAAMVQLAAAYDLRAKQFVEKNVELDAALFFAKSNQLNPDRVVRESALLRIQQLVLPRLSVEHGKEIERVDFSADGKRVLTMGDAGRVRVWDDSTGRMITEFRMDLDTYSFKRATFTRDGTKIFTAGENARLWDATTGKPLGPPVPFKGIREQGNGVTETSYVDAAALDPAEEKIVLHWSENNIVQFWDAKTSQPLGKAERFAGGNQEIAYLWDEDNIPLFSPDRKSSVVNNYAEPLELRSVATKKKIGEALRHDGNITAAAFSSDGQYIVTGGTEGTARLWRTDSGRPSTEPLRHAGMVTIVRFAPGGEFVLTASGPVACLWNRSGQLEMIMPHSAEVTAAVFCSDGKRILTGTKDGMALVWNVDDRRLLPRDIAHESWKRASFLALSPDAQKVLTFWRPERRVVGFRADGIVTEPGENGEPHLRLWNVQNGQAISPQIPCESEPKVAVFSPDRLWFATVASAPKERSKPYGFGEYVPQKLTLNLFNAKNGSRLGVPFLLSEGGSGGDSEIPEIVVLFGTSGGQLLVVHNCSVPPKNPGDGITLNATLQLLDVSGKPVGEPLTIPSRISSVVFRRSRDILLAAGNTVERWPAASAEISKEPFLQAENLVCIALSPDEKTLLTVTRDTAQLWDMETRKPIGMAMQKKSYTEMHSAAFSPDGRLAMTSDGGLIRLWDSKTGDPVGQPFRLGQGQSPRFADATHLLAPERSVIRERDLTWLLRDATPESILLEAERFTGRTIKPDGTPENIPAARLDAMRRK